MRAAVDTEPSTRLLATQAMPISAVPNASSSSSGSDEGELDERGAAIAAAGAAGAVLMSVTE